MRFHPLVFTLLPASFKRKVLKSFTLSNGLVVPAGVVTEIPTYSLSRDPNIIPNPERFDAFRSCEGGENGHDAAGPNLVSNSTGDLTFGYGRHACPGRFFAVNSMKMILSKVIMSYDIRLAPGSEGRYRNIEFGNTSLPDPNKSLLFRKIPHSIEGLSL